MERKRTSYLLAIITVLVILFTISAPSNFFMRSERASKEAKNVVLISLDAARVDHFSCNGYKRNTTPFICDFFGRGLNFKNAISQATQTTPSHISLFTSRWPFEFRTNVINNTYYDRLRPGLDFLAEILQSRGYQTAAYYEVPLEKCHVWDQGFETSNINLKHESTLKRINSALQWMRKHRQDKKFLFLHTLIVHEPYERDDGSPFPVIHPRQGGLDYVYQNGLKKYNLSPMEVKGVFKELYRKYNPQAVPFLDTVQVNYQGDQFDVNLTASLGRMIKAYDSGLRRGDDRVKYLVQRLEKLGMLNNSLIILLADHGEAFLEHGQFSHKTDCRREETHVPLFLKGPGIKNGTVKKRVRLIDVAPTVLDYLGLRIPPDFDGKSLLPTTSVKEDRKIWSVKYSRRLICYSNNDEFIYYDSEQPLAKFYNLEDDTYQLRPETTLTGRNEMKGSSQYLDLIQRKLNNYRSIPKIPWKCNISKKEAKNLRSKLRNLGYMR